MFVRSYDHSGTESSLSVKHWPHSPAAVCSLQPSFSSLCVHVAPSPLAPAPLPPCPGCRLHIWCSAELCWRGEEVGADWHMTYRMWSRGRVKGGRAAIFRCSWRTDVFNQAVWSKIKFETKVAFLRAPHPHPLQRFEDVYPFVLTALLLSAGTFPRNTTPNEAARMNQSAGEPLWFLRVKPF